MRTTAGRILLACTLLSILSPVVSAQNATQADIHAMEARILSSMGNLTAAIQTVDGQVATIQANATATNGNVSAMQLSLSNALQNLTLAMGLLRSGRNETLLENQILYGAVTNETGAPILPTIMVEQQAIRAEYLRLRGDQAAILSNMTAMQKQMDSSDRHLFATTSNTEASSRFSIWFTGLSFLMNLILIAAVLKVPRKAWMWLDEQKRRTDKRWVRGHGMVEPDCPEQGSAETTTDGRPLVLGEYFDCPRQATCPVAGACKAKAERLTEDALEQESALVAMAGDESGLATETVGEFDERSGKTTITIVPKQPVGAALDTDAMGT